MSAAMTITVISPTPMLNMTLSKPSRAAAGAPYRALAAASYLAERPRSPARMGSKRSSNLCAMQTFFASLALLLLVGCHRSEPRFVGDDLQKLSRSMKTLQDPKISADD